jgi:hypothetical protein
MPVMFRLTLVILLGLTRWAAAADVDWRDVESRIQYAWYTEDARDLATTANRVTGLPASDPLQAQYLALIHLHGRGVYPFR